MTHIIHSFPKSLQIMESYRQEDSRFSNFTFNSYTTYCVEMERDEALDLSNKAVISTSDEATNIPIPCKSPMYVNTQQSEQQRSYFPTPSSMKNPFVIDTNSLNFNPTQTQMESSLREREYKQMYNNKNEINGNQINEPLPINNLSPVSDSYIPKLANHHNATPQISPGATAFPDLRPSTPGNKKTIRPFKAYPLMTTAYMTFRQYDEQSNMTYDAFRKKMLEHVKRQNTSTTNSKMRRTINRSGSPTNNVDEKDAAYWERRKKNNQAAKRSRDLRRAKEDELAIRTAYLEAENFRLTFMLTEVFKELKKRNIYLNINYPPSHETKDV